ncbi:MAG: Hsp20/alpha crystallin family protein [Bacteroidota bacterium]
MTLVKFNPRRRAVSPFDHLFENFFNHDVSSFWGADHVNNLPAVNVMENADDFRLELAAPGLNKDDFEINIEKNRLTIKATREEKHEEVKDNYKRRGFNYTSFERSFHLPKTVNSEAISAAYDAGVLTLTLPKKEAEKLPATRKIEIV